MTFVLVKYVVNKSHEKSLGIFVVIIVNMIFLGYFIPECTVTRTLSTFEFFSHRWQLGWVGLSCFLG